MPGSQLVAALVAVTMLASACAASSRQRPLSAGPVATGPDTVEGTRARLQGTWILQSLTVAAFEGNPLSIAASGLMTFDNFGGLHLEYKISDDGLAELARAGIALPTPVVSTNGQAMIDPQTAQIVYVDPKFAGKPYDAGLADLRRNPFAIQHRRHYQFNDDGTLTLSARYDTGKDAAVGRWKRSS
jgi:hypothetical protein